MSNKDEGLIQPAPKPAPVFEIKITLDAATGQIAVSGPTNDKVLCYGMLEVAKEALSHQDKVSKLAAPPPGGIMGFVRGLKR